MMIKVSRELAEFMFENYGFDKQVGTLGEECCEVGKVVFKFLCRSDKERYMEEIHEEVADVLNMLDQISYALDMEKVHRLKREKLVRLSDRMIENGLEPPTKLWDEVDIDV